MVKVKIKYSKVLQLIFLLAFLINSREVASQIDFNALEFNVVKENIFQRPITTMVKDKFGFIWIGTDGAGLYKFNGLSYTYYGHDLTDENSINSNSISSLFLDSSGRLWIGTDAGLSSYDDRQNSFVRIETRVGNLKSENYTSVLCFAEYKGKLLIGTYDGIKEVDGENASIKNYGLSGVPILDLQYSTKGNLYIATNQGLKLEHYLNRGEIQDLSISNLNNVPHITKLHLDKRENLWIGTLRSGVFMADLKKVRTSFTKLAIVESTTMAITSGMDHVFVAVENEGLVILDLTGTIVKHYRQDVRDVRSISSNSVWSILFDGENRLWLGYYENGLGFFDEHYKKFKSILNEDADRRIQANDIRAFAKTENGNLWITQANNRIDILDTQTKKITNVYGSSGSIYKGLKEGIYLEDVFADSKGNIWLATWGEGIYLLKKGGKTFINFTSENTSGALTTNKIHCFTEDAFGRVWIGSFLKGVFYLDPKTNQIKAPSSESYKNSGIAERDVRVIHHDSNGNIWIGTSSGLYHIEMSNENDFKVIAHGNAISSKFGGHPSSNRILDIYETQDGTVWCGTNGGGLYSYNKDRQNFERLALDNYDLTYVNAIYEPIKNELWLSSKQGILRVNRTTGKVEKFTTHDGLLENYLIDRAFIMDNNNTLYLGTKKGINYIAPQDIAYNPHLAKPYLKDVKLFNRKIDKKDSINALHWTPESNSITLRHNQNILTIDYAAIAYTRPEKNQYAYYLEGFEETWNYVDSKTSATYTNLASGEYTFKLKASNNDNKWNEASVILQIQVLPPWWKTVWAYLLYLLLFSLVVFSGMYLYKKRINEINTFRLEREGRKQKVELQKQKLQFFTNISHEFRTPLTLIINPIQELIDSKETTISKATTQKYHIINKNAERLSRLINELMDFRKLQSNKFRLQVDEFNLVENTKNILSFFNEESKRRAIRLDLKYTKKNLNIWADKGILEKVLFNLLSNAFKVTPNEGKIQVRIGEIDKKILPLISAEKQIPVVEIRIKDNGPGIDQKDYKKIFKRFYQVSELNKSYYGSTGIGLEMVKSFVELHKGTVEVESELGKGSIFKIVLPYGKTFFQDSQLLESDEPLQEITTKGVLKSKPEVYAIEDILSKKEVKKKLLIAEDNVDLQDYLVSILEQDYEIILASDGQEAWLRTMEHRPDIIITDVIMPLMDGIVFSEKIKKDPTLNHIPIVILTAKDLAEDRIKGREAGAEAYLVKPFNTKELKVVLEQLLLKNNRLFHQSATTGLPEINTKETDFNDQFIQNVVDYIQKNIENTSLNVEKLSSHLCLSRSQVYRKIKSLTGLSPIEFIRRVRLEKSRTLFQNDKNLNVSEVAHKVGFLSASYFTVCYKKQFGELPKGRK
ncbi:two-component regulator propeller domain-containing protein [Maribacter sp. R77961]|uniref:two-component regulator propeller domain-containing protein n=1 Tax=Maribacter sp. R77961 TaxID=3093871 RepID=UPI0037C73D8F